MLNPGVRSFYWSETIVLPAEARKKGCTVTLSCKSEVDSVLFYIIAFDKKEKKLYTDSIIIPPTDRWTDYSLAFRQKGVQAVRIIVSYKGNENANVGKSVYLNRIKIGTGNRLLNDFPIDSLVRSKDVQLKTKAIIPLSYQDDASLAKIHDWKDKKIIALGEVFNGLSELRAVQIQLMKHLITSENCKLIMLDIPQDVCVRWNLYLQAKNSGLNESQLFEELKCSNLHNYKVFFDFLKWVRLYNAKADVPVLVIGIDKSCDFNITSQPFRDIYMTDYLLRLSTTQQDSVYYLHAMHPAMHQNEYSQVKEHILQSEWTNTLKKQDFQYLLFLMDELIRMHFSRPCITTETKKDLDKANRIERIVDLYLQPNEKAVLMAPSEQINKQAFISKFWFRESDPLGSYLYQKYGKQYYAVSIQIGERTCLVDTIAFYKKKDVSFFPVINKPLLPFAFERAAMDNGSSYFYYPSDQLPQGILGLNKYGDFRYCHIPSHFDALIFIREAKGSLDYRWSYPSRLSNLAKNVISLRLDALLK